MERFNELPLPARIAVVAVPAVIILALLFSMTMRGEGGVVLRETTDRSQAEAWKWRLDTVGADNPQNAIDVTLVANEDASNFQVRVPSQQKNTAEAALGIETDLGIDTSGQCEKPGQFDGSGARADYKLCKVEAKIHDRVVVMNGILEADVSLSTEEADVITGDQERAEASVTLFRDPNAELEMTPQALATVISSIHAPLNPSDVTISDLSGLMWPMSSGSSTAGGSSVPMAPGPDASIFEKQTYINEVLSQDFEGLLANAAGGPDKVSVSVTTELNTSNIDRQVTVIKNNPQPLSESRNSSTSGGASASSSTTQNVPSTSTTSSSTAAGDGIDRMTVAVVLFGVDAATKGRVEAIVNTIINQNRGDAATVQVTADPNAEQATATPLSEPTSTPGADAPGTLAGIPQEIAIAAGLAFAALITALVFMWRRTTRLMNERQQFNSEFQHDMSRFQDVAQANPDELAAQIQEYLGEVDQGTPTQN